MAEASYRILEHAADLRVEFRAATLEGLFLVAARGLSEMMIEGPLPEGSGAPLAIGLPAAPLDLLLRAWLGELLYLTETRRELFTEFTIEIHADGSLSAIARGRPSEELAGRFAREIKAVTYHGLSLEATPEGFRAEVLFDL